MIAPIGEKCIVLPVERPPDSTVITLVKTAKNEPPQVGKVVAVGTGEKIASQVHVGDTILFVKWGPQEVEHDGQKFVLVHLGQLVATVPPGFTAVEVAGEIRVSEDESKNP